MSTYKSEIPENIYANVSLISTYTQYMQMKYLSLLLNVVFRDFPWNIQTQIQFSISTRSHLAMFPDFVWEINDWVLDIERTSGNDKHE